METPRSNMPYVADLYGEAFLAEPAPVPTRQKRLAEYFPGIAAVIITAIAATWFSDHYGMPVILAGLLLGLALNFISSLQQVHAGLDLCGTTGLRVGILLLGTQVTAMQIGSLGGTAFLALLAIMAFTIGAGMLGARLGKQSHFTGWLAGAATAICGASAALAVYALIGQNRLDRSQFTLTLVGVAMASAIAMSFYPMVAAALALNDQQAGFLIGAATHDVAQALGGGYSFSQTAGETATIVKLSRVALLAPLVVLIGLAIGPAHGQRAGLMVRLRMPWFVVGFFVLLAINSLIAIPTAVAVWGLWVSKALLLFAVTATAMRSRLDMLLIHGWRALLPVFLASLCAFVLALAAAKFLI
jgi:uncharacterized integral membrane protein (TIGR00698 family)